MKIDVNGPDGNAHAIIGNARRLLISAGFPDEAVKFMANVKNAQSYHDVCKLAHNATGGVMRFWDDDTELEFEESA